MTVILNLDAREVTGFASAIQASATNKQWRRAMNAALNRVGRSATTKLKRDLREVTNVKTDRLNAAIVERRSNFEDLQYTVSASGRPLPLAYFDVRQTKRGVSARAWGKRTLFRGTFLATMDTGHMGVFRRGREGARRVKRYDARGHVYYSQLPIIELAGPSIPRMMLNQKIRDSFEATAKERLPIEYERELKRVVNGWKGKGTVVFDD
jgi:hypothetical protein